MMRKEEERRICGFFHLNLQQKHGQQHVWLVRSFPRRSQSRKMNAQASQPNRTEQRDKASMLDEGDKRFASPFIHIGKFRISMST